MEFELKIKADNYHSMVNQIIFALYHFQKQKDIFESYGFSYEGVKEERYDLNIDAKENKVEVNKRIIPE